MNEAATRAYSLTVRLSTEEKVALESLAERFRLDKSATVRHALTLVVRGEMASARLPDSGCFVALNAEHTVIPVRLSGKRRHDR